MSRSSRKRQRRREAQEELEKLVRGELVWSPGLKEALGMENWQPPEPPPGTRCADCGRLWSEYDHDANEWRLVRKRG